MIPLELEGAMDVIMRDVQESPPGFAIINGLEAYSSSTSSMFEQISRKIGEPMPQDGAGTLLRRVENRGTAIGEGVARYADSRFGGSFHTDGAESPFPVPDYFTLLCVRQASSGGALQMVSVDSVYDTLQAISPKLVRTLERPFHFDRRGDAPPGAQPTTAKPVLFQSRGRRAATYLREYIDSGHRYPSVPPLTHEQIDALNALDRVLADKRLVTEVRLQPGSMIIVNNQRLFHARTTFEDAADRNHGRLLLRMWLAARDH